MKYEIVFIADGNKKLGIGHVTRCLALAKEIKKRFDCRISFLMKDSDAVSKKVLGHGYEIIIDFKRADAVIVSKPDIKKKDLINAREKSKTLVILDDSSKTDYIADIIVKCSFVPQLRKSNPDSKTKFLIGPEYIILDEEFRNLNSRKKKINSKVKSILITMGGGDVNNLTPKIMRALDGTEAKKTVIIGPAFHEKGYLKNKKGYVVKKEVSDMADLMASSDMAIVGGGITLYETVCTGTPSIVLCQTGYQIMEAERFEKRNLITNLGDGRKITEEKIKSAVKSLMENKEKRGKMSISGKKTINGKGVSKVVDAIFSEIKKHE